MRDDTFAKGNMYLNVIHVGFSHSITLCHFYASNNRARENHVFKTVKIIRRNITGILC